MQFEKKTVLVLGTKIKCTVPRYQQSCMLSNLTSSKVFGRKMESLFFSLQTWTTMETAGYQTSRDKINKIDIKHCECRSKMMCFIIFDITLT